MVKAVKFIIMCYLIVVIAVKLAEKEGENKHE